MTRERLKQILLEAKKENQIGVFVYVSETAWKDLSAELKEGDRHYDIVMYKLTDKQEGSLIQARNYCGEIVPAIICLHVNSTLNSASLFNEKLDFCDKHLFEGPFVYLPSNKVVR